MNISNLQSVEQELEKALTALQLCDSNIDLARRYLMEPDAKEDVLAHAVRQDFTALNGMRFHVAGKIIRALGNASEELAGRFLKLLWAIGGISVCVIWGNHCLDNMYKDDSFSWRCKVLGPVRSAYMACRDLCGQRFGNQQTTALIALAEQEPHVLEEAQDLCGPSDVTTRLLLGAFLLRSCTDQEILVRQTYGVGALLIAGLKAIIPGIPRDQLVVLADYIAKGDVTVPVPTPSFIQNPAVDAISAQSATSGEDRLLCGFALTAFLAAGRDVHFRCALRIYLVLNPKLVLRNFYDCLPHALFVEAVELLRQDMPGGGATMLLFACAHSEMYKICREICMTDLHEAIKYADAAQFTVLMQREKGMEIPMDEFRKKLVHSLSGCVYAHDKQAALDYLMEQGGLTDAVSKLRNIRSGVYRDLHNCMDLLRDYIAKRGLDLFSLRCAAFAGLIFQNSCLYNLTWMPGGKTDAELLYRLIQGLCDEGLPVGEVLGICDRLYEHSYWDENKTQLRRAVLTIGSAERVGEIVSAMAEGSVFLRSVALELLDQQAAVSGAKEAILSAAGDSSKQVREQVMKILPKHPEWVEDYKNLLNAKKAAVRQMAAEVLGKLGERDALEAALAKEKNAKVADAIRASLGAETPAPVGSAEAMAQTLIGGNKLKKLNWLLDDRLQKLRNGDGTDAGDAIRNAILLSYCELGRIGRSETAAQLSAGLDAGDLQKLAVQVYDRWFADGAQARHKWVLPFAAVYGGTAMTERLNRAIHHWPEQQRGAIACDAVMALALSTDPSAIVIVDSISRKFKFRQVKTAAAAALENAAQELGMSAEELADRIVPDLGFGRDGRQVFDYGKRSFTVRLTAAMELEIVNDQGKTVKSMPAPGKTDDPVAMDAYEAFKTMKKGIKTTVNAQRARLESALTGLRCWDTDRWRALFVDNPIMHQFAISLIWGIYEDGNLTDTFRYMEDGTFNTVDEDEYTLPENAKIGLVHPVELEPQTLAGWKQQLEDYEIRQSIDQLSRTVHIPDPALESEKSLDLFGGKMLNALSLSGKLLQQGWYRGSVQDGGCFYCFYREDKAIGIGVELRFSGTAVGYDDGENVTVYDAVFYTGTVDRGSYVYDTLTDDQILPIGAIPARYYSEIVHQLTRATASSTETNENWKTERQ